MSKILDMVTGELAIMKQVSELRHEHRAVMCGWVGGTPRTGQTAMMARGRILTWAAAGKQAKVWREKLHREFAAAVADHGGIEAVAETLAGTAGLSLHLVFTFRTSDKLKFGAPHISRPDADNLVKVVMDVAKKAGVFGGHDDAAVAALQPVKVWGALPGLAWTLSRLERPVAGGKRHVVERGVAEPPPWMVD